MGAVFRVLLYLYPQRHRELLGAEMQAVFEQGAQQHRLLGPSQYLRFVLLEVGGLVLHAAIAQFANATHRGYLESQVHGALAPSQERRNDMTTKQGEDKKATKRLKKGHPLYTKRSMAYIHTEHRKINTAPTGMFWSAQ